MDEIGITNETELKPCPFCGGSADLFERYSATKRSNYVQVRCCECGAQGGPYKYRTEARAKRARKLAINNWNRRTTE